MNRKLGNLEYLGNLNKPRLRGSTLYHSSKRIYKDYDRFGCIEIYDQGRKRCLTFGTEAKQSEMSLDFPHQLVLEYVRCMCCGILFPHHKENALVIGVGGGTLIRFLKEYHPGYQIDGVDLREKVVQAAYDYFDLPKAPNIHITIQDGLEFLKASTKKYDLILVDAFSADGLADSIQRKIFLRYSSSVLKTGGVFIINIWYCSSEALQEFRNRMSEYFPQGVWEMQVPERENRVFFAFSVSITEKQWLQWAKNALLWQKRTGIRFLKYIRLLEIVQNPL